MTSDERFERIEATLSRIADRHEALAASVQMLSADVQQDAENIRALARNSQILYDSIKALETVAIERAQR